MPEKWIDNGDKMGRYRDLLSYTNISVWNKKGELYKKCIKDFPLPKNPSIWKAPIPIKSRNIARSLTKKQDTHPAVFSDWMTVRLIELYSKEGELVLDPMCGTATTCFIAQRMKRHSICVECVPRYLDIGKILLSQKSMDTEIEKFKPKMIVGDARNLDLDDDSIHMIVFSPPYWDIAKYDKDENQIGSIKELDDFLKEMKKVFKECFRVLKPERFCVCVISDIRKIELIDLHSEMIRLAKSVGFKLWDIVIYQRDIKSEVSKRHKNAVLRKHSVRVHEFILVFRKLKKEV